MITEHQKVEMVTLLVQDCFGASCKYQLLAESGVFVGKSSNCGLQLQSQGLSDIHCRIGLEGGRLWVQDWMSAEGTFLNGKAIDSQTTVRLGDVINIGKTRITASIQFADSTSAERECEVNGDNRPHVKIADETLPSEPDDAAYLQPKSFDHEDAISTIDEEPTASFDFEFSFEEEETYDRETVALLRAEIEELQTALAQRDAESRFNHDAEMNHNRSSGMVADDADDVLHRLQELIDEANRSDERVAILEDLLHAAEDTHRAEHEERNQLEAWVGDIEKRIGQREDEHAAETESLRKRLEASHAAQVRVQRHLQDAAFSGGAPKQYEQTLENLQTSNRQLQEQLAESQKHCLLLENRLEVFAGEQALALREERTQIAQEQAKLSRMRFELSKKLVDVEELPRVSNSATSETTDRIQALREHLREIHELEKKQEKEVSLSTRISRLWKRTELGSNG